MTAAPDARPRRLTLQAVTWSRHQLVMSFGFDELAFRTVYWYPDIDLDDLDRRYGRDFMERVHVHSALFELNKLASLRPRVLDLGPYARHHTRALEELWRAIYQGVWAQWRYENDLPDEPGPAWPGNPTAAPGPVTRDHRSESVLLFCGGGKDSLVAMKLLERAGVPFASHAYAASTYGPAAPQLALIASLQEHAAAHTRHRQIVLDDFLDAPVLELYGAELGVRTLTAAETPSSIFAALPILLARGYAHAVLGHEASANRGNLVWARTGEEVNHQWGKSLAAERLLDAYIRQELIADAGVFSVLMPIHDVVIFELLRRDLDALSATHSCNQRKPWCCRCAKCAYVWLGYRGHLPAAPVDAMFAEDLLEVPANAGFFRDLVGLGAHTPFECVGQVEESRLALRLCHARGLLGPAGTALAESLPAPDRHDLAPLLDRFLAVDMTSARIPAAIAPAIESQMRSAAASARERITTLLGS